jgi:ABC-type branched-subunit amino acid transport system substrate-binding protein
VPTKKVVGTSSITPQTGQEGRSGRLPYDAVNLLIAAVEKAGPDRGKVMEALRAYHAGEWEGVTGKYLFDQRLNNISSPSMTRVEGGRLVYWLPPN